MGNKKMRSGCCYKCNLKRNDLNLAQRPTYHVLVNPMATSQYKQKRPDGTEQVNNALKMVSSTLAELSDLITWLAGLG